MENSILLSSSELDQASPGYSKVIYAGNTLIDLTDDTVNANNLEEGYTAHDKSGKLITGKLKVYKSVQPKDINFYDYDGTLVESWTLDELFHANELPKNPSHDGLTAQGWNWSLTSLKMKVYTQNRSMNVGQMYVTDDGKTKVYIKIRDTARANIIVYFQATVAGGVTIDWGDGSAPETNLDTNANAYTHEYTEVGDYVIKFTVNDGELILGNNSTSFISGNVTGYGNIVQKIQFGYGITTINGAVFQNCYSLNSITMPNSVTSIVNNAFYNCYSLPCIVLPNSVTSISASAFSSCVSLSIISLPDQSKTIEDTAFQGCYSLKSITLPTNMASIGQRIFYNCYSLPEITIPFGVTSLSIGAFMNCYSFSSITLPSSVTSISPSVFSGCKFVKEYHLQSTSPPTLANISVFSGIPDDCVIYVPQGSLQTYQTATNWSAYAEYIKEEPT